MRISWKSQEATSRSPPRMAKDGRLMTVI